MLGERLDAATMVVHLLGGPYVSIGARRVDVPEGSKRLLAFVALNDGRVSRRHAAGTLWPDVADLRAAGNLRSSLWRLNRHCAELVDADKATLTLREGVLVDADLVSAWADRLEAGVATGPDLAVHPSGTAALDLLPGWYDDWVLGERDRLRQRLLHALEVMSARLAEVSPGEAVSAALVAVTAEPLRESAQRALIEAHIAHGNWGEAVHQFTAYRRLLAAELGVEPHPTLTRLLLPVLVRAVR
ncbi:AfsR/SARP family transcriptional regulator [Actinoplanes sp. HUAS TT8]|uniref:AfsR/SARP family transcriptional regulator n=1 Tax=Actinoplanes sp. HUAS TT8 TaxID=3447453 RepID=UPI003F5240DE